MVLSSDGEVAATDVGFRPTKSIAITAKAAAMSRAREEAATRVPLHPPRTVMTNDIRLQRAIDRRASPNATDPALLLADPPMQMPPSPTPRPLTTSRTGILGMTACDHPQWTMQTDGDSDLVVLLRVDLSELVQMTQARKVEMNLLDIMTSKDLDRPGVLPDDAVDMRKELVHEGAALFLMEEQAKSVRDLIGNLRCADEKKVAMAIYRETQCDTARSRTQAMVCCDRAFDNWQWRQNDTHRDAATIINLRSQVESLHVEMAALHDQIRGEDNPLENELNFDLTELPGDNSISFQLAKNPGPHSRNKVLGVGNTGINWGTSHHELVPDFAMATCQLPINIPFFNGGHCARGGVSYHVDDPNLQRALALKKHRATKAPAIPRKSKVKKSTKKKKKASENASSSVETTTPRVRARLTDAEDAQVRRARAHDFFRRLHGEKTARPFSAPP
jgi:hypothetical protein